MGGLFTQISLWMSGSPALAITASFVWGILSILLSPCHLSGIPLIVAYVTDRTTDVRKSLLYSFLFGLGNLVTVGIIGAITVALGRIAGDTGVWGSLVVGALLVVFGLHLAGVLKLSFLDRIFMPPEVEKNRGGSAFVLGLAFGLGLGACTFAFLAPVLSFVYMNSSAHPVQSALSIAAFAFGNCAVMVGAGALAKTVQRILKWNESTRGLDIFKKICGVLLIAGGLYFIVSNIVQKGISL